MHSLPIFLRLGHRPVLLLGEGEAVAAKRRLLDRAGARVVMDGAAALAVVGPDVPEATIKALRAAGTLVNAVDRPELCDWTLPAIVERGPVLVAVGTGGVSAGLAAAVRQRLEAWLPAQLGALAEALGAGRAALRAAWPEAGLRRRGVGALLAPGGPLDPLRAPDDPGAALAAALVAPAADVARLERVALRSADPDELTLRAARLLAQADRLFHGSDAPVAVLDRARADAVRIAGAPPAALPPGLSVEVAWA